MRLLPAALIVAFATASLAPAFAHESDRRHRHYRYEKSKREKRSSTEDRFGRCVTDNGRPLDSLDLNNRCDREEFWDRMRDRGGNWR